MVERRRISGNLVGPRLDQVMNAMGWGARERVTAKIHLLAGHDPRFADLADLDVTSLSRLRHGERACSDIELMALAIVTRRSPTWLCGMSDDEDLTDNELLRLADEL